MFIFLFKCSLKSNGDHFHLQTSKGFQKKPRRGANTKPVFCCEFVRGGVSGNHGHTDHIIGGERVF